MNKVQKHFRVEQGTADRLNEIAIALGYIHGYKNGVPIPAVGELLDDISRLGEKLVEQKDNK